MTKRLRALMLLMLPLLLIMAAGCGGDPTPTSPGPTATPTPVKVRLALDWYPNANHAGLYIAQAKGYFSDEGLEVEMYTPSGPFDGEPDGGGGG